MVDGRVVYAGFLPFREELRRITGRPDERIKHSLLYEKPDDFVAETP